MSRSRCSKDVKSQAPKAVCELVPTDVSINLIVNPVAAVRQCRDPQGNGAGARPQGVHRHPEHGKADISGAMLPPPEGVWGMPPDVLKTLPGYCGDVEKSRAEARKIMEEPRLQRGQAPQGQGLDPQHRRLSRSGGDPHRPAQEIHIEGELEVVDTSIWHAKVRAKQEYSVGLNLTGVGVDVLVAVPCSCAPNCRCSSRRGSRRDRRRRRL